MQRTEEVMKRAGNLVLGTPGVGHIVNIAGFSGATFTNAPNAGAIFSTFVPYDERARKGLSAGRILADLHRRLHDIDVALSPASQAEISRHSIHRTPQSCD